MPVWVSALEQMMTQKLKCHWTLTRRLFNQSLNHILLLRPGIISCLTQVEIEED